MSAERAAQLGSSVCALILLALISACSGPSPNEHETPDDTATRSDEATEPPEGNAPNPGVWVISTPEGYTEESPDNLPNEWTTILRGDECSLEARGNLAEGEVDMRDTSVALLEEMAAESDSSAGPVNDIPLTTQGSGIADNPANTLTFATADWRDGNETVRGVVRAANIVLYDGTAMHQSLELRFICIGDQIDNTAWEAVTSSIRPVLHYDESAPWRRGN